MEFQAVATPPNLVTLQYLDSTAAAGTPPVALNINGARRAAGGMPLTLPNTGQPWWALPAAGVWTFQWSGFNISANYTGTFRRFGFAIRAISLGDVPAFVNSTSWYAAAATDMLGDVTLAVPAGYQVGLALAHDAVGLVGTDARLHCLYLGPCVTTPYPYDLAPNP